MSSEPKRVPLPFEPRQKKKKPTSKTSNGETNSPQNTPGTTPVTVAKTPTTTKKPAKQSSQIPEIVSKRMLRRMAVFSGIPTGLALSSFFIFYWIVTNKLLQIPTTAVVLTTFGLFGLGVVGLSYGLLSASWDEQRVGTKLGWEEFTLNFGRMTSAFSSAKKEAKSK